MNTLITLAPWTLPLVYLAWWLSPWSIRQTENYSKKRFFRSYWGRRVYNGNNPLSRRVHEGGGGRFTAILITLVMALVAFASRWFEPGTIPLFLCTVAQIAAGAITFQLSERWIDVAEHGAEGIHGDRAQERGELHPEALEWLDGVEAKRPAFETYSAGEAWRLTQPNQSYSAMSPDEFTRLLRKRRWASRIILALSW
jgi:hypothetical protein